MIILCNDILLTKLTVWPATMYFCATDEITRSIISPTMDANASLYKYFLRSTTFRTSGSAVLAHLCTSLTGG